MNKYIFQPNLFGKKMEKITDQSVLNNTFLRLLTELREENVVLRKDIEALKQEIKSNKYRYRKVDESNKL